MTRLKFTYFVAVVSILETLNNLQIGGFATTDLYCLITFLKNRTDILASILSVAV